VLLTGLTLINVAFFMTSFATLAALLGYFIAEKKLWHKFSRSQLRLAAVGCFAIVLVIMFSSVGKLLSSYLLSGGFFRSFSEWGFSYASKVIEGGIQVNHAYLPVNTVLFWQAMGILPLLSIVTLLARSLSFKKLSLEQRYLLILLLTSVLLFPLYVYFGGDRGLGLALNKLLRPGVLLLPLVYFLLPDKGFMKQSRFLWLGLLLASMISPSYYLLVNNGQGLQQFWKNLTTDDQEVIRFLHEKQISDISTTSWRSSYIFANSVPVQTQVCVECSKVSTEYVLLDKTAPISETSLQLHDQVLNSNSYFIFQLK
jgi:hypothetical protein